MNQIADCQRLCPGDGRIQVDSRDDRGQSDCAAVDTMRGACLVLPVNIFHSCWVVLQQSYNSNLSGTLSQTSARIRLRPFSIHLNFRPLLVTVFPVTLQTRMKTCLHDE